MIFKVALKGGGLLKIEADRVLEQKSGALRFESVIETIHETTVFGASKIYQVDHVATVAAATWLWYRTQRSSGAPKGEKEKGGEGE